MNVVTSVRPMTAVTLARHGREVLAALEADAAAMEAESAALAAEASRVRELAGWVASRVAACPAGPVETPGSAAEDELPTTTVLGGEGSVTSPAEPPLLQADDLVGDQASVAGLSQADAAAAVLAVRPGMTPTEIAEAMLARGFVIDGPTRQQQRQRLAASLCSLLRKRTERFESQGQGRWALARRPTEPAIQ